MIFIHLKEGDLQDTQKCGRVFKTEHTWRPNIALHHDFTTFPRKTVYKQ